MDLTYAELKEQLHEREKELDALYKLSVLFTEPNLSSDIIINKAADILKESMQYQKNANVQILITELDNLSEDIDENMEEPCTGGVCSASAIFSIAKQITINITYSPDVDAMNHKLVFLKQETHLVKSTAALLANVLQKTELESILRQSTSILQQQTEDLENKNIALKEILSQYGMDKENYLAEIHTYFDSIIFPAISKLILYEPLSTHSRDGLSNIKTSIENKFLNNFDILTQVQHLLTPRELEICSLIKNGLATKEISSHLNISELTVERHRNTIRRKLKLNNSNINLTTYLRSPP